MKKYKDIKKEDIEKYLENIYGEEVNKLTYEELKSRVLSSYHYTINPASNEYKEGQRNIKINTDSGGVLMMLDACEKIGLPALVIAQEIICHTDKGSYPLSQLKIKKNEK